MARELLEWLAGSPRFRAFAETHRDKIRKKFRGATDAESLRDVRAELQTARLLLADRRIELAYEAYGSGKGGPDFTVTFRGARSFNLEVTQAAPSAGRGRPRRSPAGQASPAATERPERDPLRDRWRQRGGARRRRRGPRAPFARRREGRGVLHHARYRWGARVLRALPAAERRIRLGRGRRRGRTSHAVVQPVGPDRHAGASRSGLPAPAFEATGRPALSHTRCRP